MSSLNASSPPCHEMRGGWGLVCAVTYFILSGRASRGQLAISSRVTRASLRQVGSASRRSSHKARIELVIETRMSWLVFLAVTDNVHPEASWPSRRVSHQAASQNRVGNPKNGVVDEPKVSQTLGSRGARQSASSRGPVQKTLGIRQRPRRIQEG